MKGYFVTGTGTDVGKTYVTAALARLARARGQRVFAFKPIETGCTNVGGRLVGTDQRILCEAAGDWQTGDLRGVYCFEPPMAPSMVGEPIDLQRIADVFFEGCQQAEIALVEGAGGWRVPISALAEMGDLARACRLPILIVARTTLGTINHSLLTIESVERSGMSVAAVVMSRRATDPIEEAERNRQEIAARWPGQVVVFGADPDLECFT